MSGKIIRQERIIRYNPDIFFKNETRGIQIVINILWLRYQLGIRVVAVKFVFVCLGINKTGSRQSGGKGDYCQEPSDIHKYIAMNKLIVYFFSFFTGLSSK